SGDRKLPWESARVRVHELWMYSEIGSFSRFSHTCGVPVDRLDEILETDEIDDDTAGKIAAALNVEYEWVRYGTGPFRKRRTELEDRPGCDTTAGLDRDCEWSGQSRPAIRHEFVHVGKTDPKISSQGEVFPEEDPANERYAFRVDWLRSIGAIPGNVVLLEVEGDSMSPVLQEGDTVLIDLNRTRFKEGGLFAVGVGDSLLVKRLQIVTGDQGPQIRVISVNPEYHTWECGPEDIKILGEVIWFGRTVA
ncbi:MAG: S24 family peptidase, partial [Desulfomonilaceae bacterium]|nr:S24 family peptidase [Desulfomonilaceae bacterium]